MLVAVILVFTLLGAINFFVGNKSAALYPPALFCIVWLIALLAVAFFQQYFYQFLPATLTFFCLGAVAFSVGSWIPTFFSKPPKPIDTPPSKLLLRLMLWIATLGTPLSFYWLYKMAMENGVAFLVAARKFDVENQGISTELMLSGIVSELAFIAMLIIFYDSESSRKKKVFIVFLNLLLSLEFGSKGGPMSLLIALIAVQFIKTKKMNWRIIGATVVLSFVILGAVNFYSHFSGDTDSRMESVMLAFPLYESGGLVGFDRVMRDPSSVPQYNQIDNNIQRIARKLGSKRAIVENNSEFVKIGTDTLFETNVYTLFWNYLNWGLSGTLAAVFCLGIICSWVYQRALSGHMISALAYPFLAFSIAFSTFTEYFIGRAYLFSHIIIIGWLVYYLPKLVPSQNWLVVTAKHFRAAIHKSVQDDLRSIRRT